MQDFDRLPTELRVWLAAAKMPWGVVSAQRTYARALRRTGNTADALAEMDRLQDALVRKDVSRVWGLEHPEARSTQDVMPS